MFAGTYLFDSPSKIKIIQMHVHKEPLPLHAIDQSIPVPLSHIILKLMEKDVDLRYKSAKAIIHDMDLIISEYNPRTEMLLAQ